MKFVKRNESRRLLGQPSARVLVASVLALGSTVVAGGAVTAADDLGLAVVDCNLDGDQFMLADGEAQPADYTVAAVDVDGNVVETLTAVDSEWERLTQIYRSYTVPAGTVYDGVLFTNNENAAEQKVMPVEEPCEPTPVNLATADPGPGLVLTPPTRVLDTRVPAVSPNASSLRIVPAGGIVEVPVVGVGGIPADASAVQLNVAAVQPRGVGYVQAYPCGTKRPLSSNLNYIENETRAANVFVKPGVDGKVCLYTSAITHLIADTQGYVAAKSEPVAIEPLRVADTRAGAPVDGPGLLARQKVAGAVRLDMTKLADFSDVPANATGYVVNITATNSSDVGFVRVNLCRTTFRPARISSALNFIPKRATANLAFGTFADEFCIEVSQPVDLIVDVIGYTTSAYGSPQLFDENLRLLDTRPESGPFAGTVDGKHIGVGRLAAGTVYQLDVAGRADNIPANIAAAVVNITGVRPDANGHITAYDCGKKPETSNLNIRPGEATANLSLVPVGADGKICLYTSVATDLVVDISGFVSSTKTPVTVEPIELSQAEPKTTLTVLGGQAPYTLTGNLPSPLKLAIDDNGTITYAGDPNTFTHFAGLVPVSDANGNLFSVRVTIAWYPEAADVFSGVVID